MSSSKGPSITKAKANYKPSTPAGSNHCGTCNMFCKPSSCTLVQGLISPNGVCKYWEKK